jgi:hypothetical protein
MLGVAGRFEGEGDGSGAASEVNYPALRKGKIGHPDCGSQPQPFPTEGRTGHPDPPPPEDGNGSSESLRICRMVDELGFLHALESAPIPASRALTLHHLQLLSQEAATLTTESDCL